MPFAEPEYASASGTINPLRLPGVDRHPAEARVLASRATLAADQHLPRSRCRLSRNHRSSSPSKPLFRVQLSCCPALQATAASCLLAAQRQIQRREEVSRLLRCSSATRCSAHEGSLRRRIPVDQHPSAPLEAHAGHVRPGSRVRGFLERATSRTSPGDPVTIPSSVYPQDNLQAVSGRDLPRPSQVVRRDVRIQLRPCDAFANNLRAGVRRGILQADRFSCSWHFDSLTCPTADFEVPGRRENCGLCCGSVPICYNSHCGLADRWNLEIAD